MGAASSVKDRRYDYSAASFSDEDGSGVGGMAALEMALSFVKGDESRYSQRRRNSRAKVDFIAKPQYNYHPSKDYKFEKMLGEGAFSKVFRAFKPHQRGVNSRPNSGVSNKNKENIVDGDNPPLVQLEISSERVAVKEVQLKHLSKHQVQNMEMEVQILSQLDHPDVVKMHAVYRVPNQMFIVLEYLRGGELLKAICQRKRYTEDDARAILRPILEGVRYLHSRDVIHRDIKPENLILSDKSLGSQIKIVDFGFACLVDRSGEGTSRFFRRPSLSRTGSNEKKATYLCGTPGYLAPEVIEYKQYGTACDMWSVGVVVYILLSGTMPFSIKSYKHVLTGNFEFPDDRWATVSPGAKDLIRKLLIVDPEKRYTADMALGHDWLRNVGVVGVEGPATEQASTRSAEIAKDARVARMVTSKDAVDVLVPPSKASFGSGSNLGASSGSFSDVKKRKSEQSVDDMPPGPMRPNTSKDGPGGSITAQGSGTGSGVKKERSHDYDSFSGPPLLGDLTGNIPSIRNFTAMKKFHRSVNVVTAMVRFRGAGLQRERRRSESIGSSGSDAEMDTTSSLDQAGMPPMTVSDLEAETGAKQQQEAKSTEMQEKEEGEMLTEVTPRLEGPPTIENSAALDAEFMEEASMEASGTVRYVD